MYILPKPLAEYPWYLRLMFKWQRHRYGRPLDAALLWGRRPRLFLRFLSLHRGIDGDGSPLDPALRSLVMVRVSQINHCAFCVDLNTATLMKRNVPTEKANAVSDWRGNGLFQAHERAALEYAEAITLSDRIVDDAMIAALRAHYDDDAIVELTALIAFQNMSSKFNSALDVPPQGFCILERRSGDDEKTYARNVERRPS